MFLPEDVAALLRGKSSTKRDTNTYLSKRKPMVLCIPHLKDHRFVLRCFGILMSSSWVFVLKYALVLLRQNTSSNPTPIYTKPLISAVLPTTDLYFDVFVYWCRLLECLSWSTRWYVCDKTHLRIQHQYTQNLFEQIRWLRYWRSFLLEVRFLLFDNGHQSSNRYHQP